MAEHEHPADNSVIDKTAPAVQPAQSMAGKAEHKKHWPGNLALVLAICVAISAVYFWRQLTATLDGQQQQLDQYVQMLSEQRQQFTQQQQELLQQLQHMQQVEKDLSEAVVELRALAGNSSRQWALTEAEYLLRIANDHLLLNGDKSTALYPLRQADKILKQLKEPGLQAVRQQLAQEIAVLEGVDEPDITGLSAQISALSKTVTGLPMQGRRMAMPEQRPGEAEQAQPFWKRFVLSLWQEIKTLVVIRHDGKAIAPLLPPEQEEFLYLNLQHKLESARLALLKGQTSIWRDNLQAAQDWARRYFDPDAQETRAIVEALARLHDSTISVNLPDISESLRLLQEFRQRQARQTSSRHDASSMAGIFVTPAHSG